MFFVPPVGDEPHVSKRSWGLIFNCAAAAILVLALGQYVLFGQARYRGGITIEDIVQLLFEGILIVLLGSLINAVFTKIATRWQMKFNPPYSMAWKACVTISFLSYSIVLLLELTLAPSDFESASTAIGIISSFIICTLVFGKMILHPQTGPIGLLNGFLLTVMAYLVGLILVGIPVFVIFVLWGLLYG